MKTAREGNAVDVEAAGDVYAGNGQDERVVQGEAVPAIPHSTWSRQWDDASAKFFYVDAATGESTWRLPEGFHEPEAFPQAEMVAHSASGTNESEADAVSSAGSVGEADVWVAQYDPSASRVYYYNPSTGTTQWDRPESYVEGTRDLKMMSVVKIQSIVRAKTARLRVQRMADAEGTPGVRSRPESAASDDGRVWRRHYDPRSQHHYYHNVITGEVTWNEPTGDGELLAHADPQGDSATAIQCAFRKRAASKCVAEKKQIVRDLTSAEVIDQKLKDLMRAVDDVHGELNARRRTLASTTAKYPALAESVEAWGVPARQMRDRVLDHHHHARLVQRLEVGGADRLATAQQFHDAMAATRSDCLTLMKSILLTDSSFVEMDVARVNSVYGRFEKCKLDGLFAVSESKIRSVIRVDELEAALARMEKTLRKAMGLTDFGAGKMSTMRAKAYTDIRDDTQAAVESMAKLEQMMEHKRALVDLYTTSLLETKEVADMERQDELSCSVERTFRNAEQEKRAHTKFLEDCRARWRQGLDRRQEDEEATGNAARVLDTKHLREKERIEQLKTTELERLKRIKLSIWEAVKAGHPAEAIRAMVLAEMQKARQNGFDFVVRTARSSRGETLIQIACWGGHTELVEFLLEEGADLRAVDSLDNGFTLLHDAARRGHAQIIRLLVDRGLGQDVVDRSGDTPLHWAVRKNYYDAVHTLLGAYMHRHDPDHNECALRAVRTKNNRGRTPIALAKSECMRRLLHAFDEGRFRMPQFRRPSVVSQSARHHSHRMSDTNNGSPMTRPGSSRSLNAPNHKGATHLAKASTVGTLMSPTHSQQQSAHEEDEFGVINVVSSRR